MRSGLLLRQRADQPRTFPPRLSTHMETETALRGVRIDGKHMPRHRVCPCGQSSDTDAHYVAADALAFVHTRTRGIAHFRAAKLWFELLCEVERDLPRGAANSTADSGICMIEHGM